MNWKFWQIGKANEQIEGLRRNIEKLTTNVQATPLQLFDPAWPEKRHLFLDRLANTMPNDALMNGVLGMIDQELLIQVQKCEARNVTETEAISLCGRIGLLVGLRADLQNKWKEQLAKRVNEGKK